MVCPNCFNQLIQATYEMEALGNGFGSENQYLTWEVKYCRNCGEYYLEQYSAIKLNIGEVEQIAVGHINLKALIGQKSTDLIILRKE